MERGKEIAKRTVEELKAYEAPEHFGCTAMRIHGKEETGAVEFWIGISTFPPGGGTEYTYEDNPLEEVYYVLEGETTVKDNEGSTYVIHKDESISLKPFEGRYLKNKSNLPARVLVIINYPET